MQQPATTEFRHVPLTQLRVSPTLSQIERRQHLDKAAIAELAESIATVGILQPLVVRPLTDGPSARGFSFEIVAGERRFLAAKAAKLATVPVNVRELTDEQVLEVQLVENLQRADVHPMAEAEGYEGLRKIGRTVDEIADKVGKSKGYVYGRMKLLELVPAARKAFYAGSLSASTALYIARVPTSLQDQATKEITEDRYGGGPMSARKAAEHLQQNYMLRLTDAGFRTEDAALVPSAGACGACPKRTGNQPQLFGDVKGADVCTDPVCFKSKIAAHAERALAKAAGTGQQIIAGDEARKRFKHGTDDYDLRREGFVRLGARNYGDKGTYRQTLGKDYVPTLVQDPDTGKLIEVAPTKDLPKDKRSSSGGDDMQARQRAESKKRELELACRRAVFRAIHEEPVKTGDDRVILLAAVKRAFSNLPADTQQLLAKALEWDLKATKRAGESYGRHINPEPFVAKMGAPEIWKFLRAVTIAGELGYYQFGNSMKTPLMDAMASLAGVNVKRVRDQVVAEAKAKETAKKAKAKASAKKKAAKK